MSNPSIIRSPLPMVALVGRANVGKSTLWNRIVEHPRALISDQPHTTRDRAIESALWRGQRFEVVDTGGLDTENNEIGQGIRRQAERAIKDADLVIFMVDGKTGAIAEDKTLASLVRKNNKNVILAVNKLDHPRDLVNAADRGMYGLGLGEPIAVSASTGKGVGDLLDIAYQKLEAVGRPAQDASPADKDKLRKKTASKRAIRAEEDAARGDVLEDTQRVPKGTPENPLRIVLIGRPNVGKSSLTNSILGEERVIASAIEHTTREPQDTPFEYKGYSMLLVDTAGMRKQANVKRGLEEEGIERNRQALRDADIAFLVFDATEDPKSQDRHLAGLLKDSDKGLILVANKWDLVDAKHATSTNEYEAVIRQLFPFLSWAPMVFVSAKNNLRTRSLLDEALKVQEERNRKIDYNAVNKFLKATLKQKRPMASYGPKSPYIHDMAQVRSEPPTFLITIRGEKETVHAQWLRFAERRLRDKFGFEGTPIVIKAENVPMAKSERERNVRGPGMEAVAGKLKQVGWEKSKKKNVRWRP